MAPYSTNKWVGLDIGAGSYLFNTEMYNYLETNGWGLWMEQGSATISGKGWSLPNFWMDAGVYAGGGATGTNNQTAVITDIQTYLEPYLTTINNNYSIPVRIDAKGLGTQTSSDITWYHNNFDSVMAYYEEWCNGVKGNCVVGYWSEGGQQYPVMHQYLRQATTRTITWGYMARWGPWTTLSTAQLQTLFSYADIVDIEMWWISDLAQSIPLVEWILTYEPTKPIGLDSQGNGSWPDTFHLWGFDWDGPDAQPTYAEQRSRFKRYSNGLKTELGKPFESLTVEVAGDCGDIPGGCSGWTGTHVVTEQIGFWDNCKFMADIPSINDMGVQYNP